MTTAEIMSQLREFPFPGWDGSASVCGLDFLANIIQAHHARPHRKLKGLLHLARAGHRAVLAPYTTDVLMVDNVKAPWSVLEEWSTRKS